MLKRNPNPNRNRTQCTDITRAKEILKKVDDLKNFNKFVEFVGRKT